MADKSTGRIKAFLIHFSISLVIVSSVLLLVFLLWYPAPYHKVAGAWGVVKILILVDLIIGPVLTLIIFKRGKPGLKFDLSMIASVQIIALTYGVSVVYQERPLYIVFTVDRFEVVGASEIDMQKIRYNELKTNRPTGPALAFAKFPEDRQERNKLMFDVILQGLPDLDRRPEHYHPYSGNEAAVLERSLDVRKLVEAEDNDGSAVDRFLATHGGQVDDYAYLPLVGRRGKMVLAVDRDSARPVAGIDINPWPHSANRSS